MDLRKQLHDVLYARVLFTLVVLTAVLWVQINDHVPLPEEVGVALAVILLVNVPFFLLANRVETHTLTGAMVVVDILLVTAGVVYAGGALSSAGVFYVWPIVLSSVFISAWARSTEMPGLSRASVRSIAIPRSFIGSLPKG